MTDIQYFNDDDIKGPGWHILQETIKTLSKNFTFLCEALTMIVDLENTKLVSTGRLVIPESARRILENERKFIEKCKSKLVESEDLKFPDKPEYVEIYEAITNKVVSTIDSFKDSISMQLQSKTKAMKNLIEENQSMLNNNKAIKDELYQERVSHEETIVSKNTLLARCNKLEEQMVEKAKDISKLKREINKALWDKEKERLVDDIHSKEDELEIKLKTVTEGTIESNERLRAKIQSLQDKIYVMKTREGMSKGMSKTESDKLKRQLFIKERTLIVAESEIKKQQIYYYGLLTGLKRDYQIILSKRHPDTLTVNEKNYKDNIEKITKAVHEGNIASVRVTLPSHYLGIEVKLKGSPLKNSSDNEYSSYNIEEDVDLENIDVNSNLYDWRNSEYISPTLGKLLRDMKNKHPKLVLRNGTLMIRESLTYFPNFHEKKIKDYFEAFKSVDTNGDLNLDTEEILKLLPVLIGKLSTKEEVATAIKEVDLDQSGTIDFFEFLVLIQILEHREGKSNLYQRTELLNAVNEKDKKESKVCVIQ